MEDIKETVQENTENKLFYSIGEVAKMFNVNTSLIRYWEKEFAVIKPKKNAKGNRLFTKKDIENFHKIYYLVKERGMTLPGAKKVLKNKSVEPPRKPGRRGRLVAGMPARSAPAK